MAWANNEYMIVPMEKAPSPREASAGAFWSLGFANPWEARGM